MRFIRAHREQKVKDLRFEPNEHGPELKISWTDEEGTRQTAWITCNGLRSTRSVFEKKAK